MELIKEVIEGHGGLTNWNRYNRIVTTLSFGGLAFHMKFNNMGRAEHRYIISLDHPMVVIEGFPRAGQQGVFTPGAVWIESFDGKKIRERNHPRTIIRKGYHSVVWDALDLLDSAGYACWNYFNTPFLFAGDNFTFKEVSDWEEGGKWFKRVEVIFPEEIPAHCTKQTFYIDNNYKISRFDYDPEVFASWARAAHYCLDYKKIGGIWLSTKRKVAPRNSRGHAAQGPRLVWINIKDIHFQ